MKLLLLSLACCIAMAGCSDGGANSNSASNGANVAVAGNSNTNASSTAGYPQATADAFLKSCEEAGSDRPFCTCVFDKVQAKYTFEEFAAIEAQLVDGDPPEEFVEFTGKAREECTKK